MDINQIIESKIFDDYKSDDNARKFYLRYRVEKPDLDDVRFELARVDTRGYIKWIKFAKLKKKHKCNKQFLACTMIQPILRGLNLPSIARSVFKPIELLAKY